MVLDIDPQRKDVIKEIIEALSKVYVGIKPPEGLVIPPEDPAIRKSAFETLLLFEKTVRSSQKGLEREER